MDNFSIDLSQVDSFVEKAGKLIFQADAEDALLKLLQIQDLINLKVSQVKEEILRAAQTVDPNFKGIVGAKIKATARSWGAKYELVDLTITPSQYTEEERKIKLNTKAIDEHRVKFGTLPEGIRLKERTYQLALSPLDNGQKELEV